MRSFIILSLLAALCLSSSCEDNDYIDHDRDYSASQWYTLGALLKKDKLGGKVLIVGHEMSYEDKQQFRAHEGRALMDGLGAAFTLEKMVCPEPLKEGFQDRMPSGGFDGAHLQLLLNEYQDYSVIVFTCQLPWQRFEILQTNLCKGPAFHQLKKDHPDYNFDGKSLPAIAVINPALISSNTEKMIREKRIDVAVRWKPGHSVDSEPEELPESKEEVSAIRYIMITSETLPQMLKEYRDAKPRLFAN